MQTLSTKVILQGWLLGAIAIFPAHAQHNHAAGHADYSSWSSQKTQNCCNNMDCGALNDDEWRESIDGVEIKILGEWCSVKPEHFLTRGKSPDWSRAHACVQRGAYVTKPTCERLLCFVGAPRF